MEPGGIKNATLTAQGISSETSTFKDHGLKIRPTSQTTYSVSTEYKHTKADKTTTFNLYLRDNNGTPDLYSKTGNSTEWELQVLNSTNIDKNYFGAAPNPSLTKTVGGETKYYTTLYTTFPYELQGNTKAYYIGEKSITTTEKQQILVTATEIGSKKIPANFAVILECDGTTAAENKLLPIFDNDNSIVSSTNLLRGQIKLKNGEKKGDGNIFVLSTGSKGIGYYKLKNGIPIPDNKAYAYLDTEAQEAAKNAVFNFGSETGPTGIHELKAANPATNNTTIYDLQGRKVSSLQKGIYIINGKKLVRK